MVCLWADHKFWVGSSHSRSQTSTTEGKGSEWVQMVSAHSYNILLVDSVTQTSASVLTSFQQYNRPLNVIYSAHQPRAKSYLTCPLRCLQVLSGGPKYNFVHADIFRLVYRKCDHSGKSLGGNADFTHVGLICRLDVFVADVVKQLC